MTFNLPSVETTSPHRLATDTAISWRLKNPQTDGPPNNIPQFSGQLIAVPTGATSCKLYVGSEDRSRWYVVEG